MSRRPAAPPVGRINTARARMAPGGRMWSESPIRAPRRRVAMAGAPAFGEPPTAMIIAGQQNVGGGAITLPEFPTGMTSAVALVGWRGRTGLVVPDGWTVLATGAQGTSGYFGGRISQWALLSIDGATGAEDRVCDFPTLVGGGESTYDLGSYSCAYFTGGDGGSWGHIHGTDTSNFSGAYVTAVPPGTPAWVQMGLLSAVYQEGDSGGTDYSAGLCAQYTYPARGTYSTIPTTPLPGGTVVDWEGIGAYGEPCSVSVAAVWSP